MDNQTQKQPITADPAEAEQEKAAAVLGKFKDVKALMDAYTALEAEFTRRSQRLKELEANKEEDPHAQAEELPSQCEKEGIAPAICAEQPLDDEIKKAVIEEYLNGICANRGVPIITVGGAVAAQRRTPATVGEAGALAREFFNKRED